MPSASPGGSVTLLAKPHPRSPGYSGLLITLDREETVTPTLRLHVPDAYGAVDATRLTLGRIRGSWQVCPGRVVLDDPWTDRLYFFTFGGELNSGEEGKEVVYALHTPVPLLPMGAPTNVTGGELAVETETLLARVRARLRSSSATFGRRLANAKPMQLYTSTLSSLLRYYNRCPALQTSHPHLYQLLRSERRTFRQQGLWPTPPEQPSTVAILLGADSA